MTQINLGGEKDGAFDLNGNLILSLSVSCEGNTQSGKMYAKSFPLAQLTGPSASPALGDAACFSCAPPSPADQSVETVCYAFPLSFYFIQTPY